MELEPSRRTSPELESLSVDSAMADEMDSGGGPSTEEIDDSMDEGQGEGQGMDDVTEGPIDLTNAGCGNRNTPDALRNQWGNHKKLVGIRFLFPPPDEKMNLLERARVWAMRHDRKYFVGWTESELKAVDPKLRPLSVITKDLYKTHMNRSEYCRNVKLKYCLEADSGWAEAFRDKLKKSASEGGFTGLCQAKIAAAELWRRYSENYRSHQARRPAQRINLDLGSNADGASPDPLRYGGDTSNAHSSSFLTTAAPDLTRCISCESPGREGSLATGRGDSSPNSVIEILRENSMSGNSSVYSPGGSENCEENFSLRQSLADTAQNMKGSLSYNSVSSVRDLKGSHAHNSISNISHSSLYNKPLAAHSNFRITGNILSPATESNDCNDTIGLNLSNKYSSQNKNISPSNSMPPSLANIKLEFPYGMVSENGLYGNSGMVDARSDISSGGMSHWGISPAAMNQMVYGMPQLAAAAAAYYANPMSYLMNPAAASNLRQMYESYAAAAAAATQQKPSLSNAPVTSPVVMTTTTATPLSLKKSVKSQRAGKTGSGNSGENNSEYRRSERGLSFLFPSFSDHNMSLLEKINITIARHKNNYFLGWDEEALSRLDPIVRPKMAVTPEIYKEYCHRNAMKYDSNLQFAMESDFPWADEFRSKLTRQPAEGGFSSLCEVKLEAGRLWREYSGKYRMHNIVKWQMDMNNTEGGRVVNSSFTTQVAEADTAGDEIGGVNYSAGVEKEGTNHAACDENGLTSGGNYAVTNAIVNYNKTSSTGTAVETNYAAIEDSNSGDNVPIISGSNYNAGSDGVDSRDIYRRFTVNKSEFSDTIGFSAAMHGITSGINLPAAVNQTTAGKKLVTKSVTVGINPVAAGINLVTAGTKPVAADINFRATPSSALISFDSSRSVNFNKNDVKKSLKRCIRNGSNSECQFDANRNHLCDSDKSSNDPWEVPSSSVEMEEPLRKKSGSAASSNIPNSHGHVLIGNEKKEGDRMDVICDNSFTNSQNFCSDLSKNNLSSPALNQKFDKEVSKLNSKHSTMAKDKINITQSTTSPLLENCIKALSFNPSFFQPSMLNDKPVTKEDLTEAGLLFPEQPQDRSIGEQLDLWLKRYREHFFLNYSQSKLDSLEPSLCPNQLVTPDVLQKYVRPYLISALSRTEFLLNGCVDSEGVLEILNNKTKCDYFSNTSESNILEPERNALITHSVIKNFAISQPQNLAMFNNFSVVVNKKIEGHPMVQEFRQKVKLSREQGGFCTVEDLLSEVNQIWKNLADDLKFENDAFKEMDDKHKISTSECKKATNLPMIRSTASDFSDNMETLDLTNISTSREKNNSTNISLNQLSNGSSFSSNSKVEANGDSQNTAMSSNKCINGLPDGIDFSNSGNIDKIASKLFTKLLWDSRSVLHTLLKESKSFEKKFEEFLPVLKAAFGSDYEIPDEKSLQMADFVLSFLHRKFEAVDATRMDTFDSKIEA